MSMSSPYFNKSTNARLTAFESSLTSLTCPRGQLSVREISHLGTPDEGGGEKYHIGRYANVETSVGCRYAVSVTRRMASLPLEGGVQAEEVADDGPN
jgi:hypothetical protein